ncbi:signal peptidase I [Novosphingobium sp.]|uniref:signal peptidase I n=1 Tax=Novosphingobium sp. TaxID=1874826 RepID=UPI0025F91509|nr:signal peptidase I [Novosphingobium sp.]MCC6926091.1 signal peptidase I [Novosphingobium sp.]
MTDTPAPTAADSPAADTATPAKKAKKEDSFPVFVLKLAIVVVLFRSFVFAPFYIPSESMVPRLVNGDYLLLAKWPYGYSYRSLPFSVPLLPDSRILASMPERGDVVVFKAPAHGDEDWIKRVIGLPGDTVQMKGGQLWLNNQPVPKVAITPFEVKVSPNTRCYSSQFLAKNDANEDVCRYPRFTETLPGGESYEVLDLVTNGLKDDTDPVIVPEGHVFLMGDNRDNSQDSRYPADPGGGIGIVPVDNLIGRATVMMWSTDGSAEWLKPWTWFSAARWNRIGGTF